MKNEEEDWIAKGARLKVEEHERARINLEEGVRLALESRRQAEEDNHLRLKAEEGERIAE